MTSASQPSLEIEAQGRAWRARLLFAAVALTICACPFGLSAYHTFQLTGVLINAIALMGMILLIGYSGQISLGHGAFYALGAYATAIPIDRWQMPYLATIPFAGMVCFAFGFLFGLPALRLQGIYLALATFALGVATPQILTTTVLDDLTGGVQGLTLPKVMPPAHLPLSSDQWIFLIVFATALILYSIIRRLGQGSFRRSLIALRDHPVAASCMGIDISMQKTLVFAVSAAYTGVAGGLSALSVQFVAPDSFGSLLSISLLVGTIIGGTGAWIGALFGAVFIEFVPIIADSISKSATWGIYGLMLIGAMYIMPAGVAGLLHKRRIALVAKY